MHLYFGSADAENVVRKGFYNIHQRPDLKYTDTRILVRDFAEIRASMLTLAKETTLNADDPVNKLRTKSAILELFLPEGKRPKTMGGVRYGDFVAVFKDEVKRRAMVVPHDSAVIANDFISMEEIRKEVRPLLDFDHLLGTQERLSNTEYYEAMIWGELDIRDVKEFMVKPGSDPALVRPLIDSGLPVYEFVEITEGEEHNRYYKNYQRIRGKMLSPGDPDKMKALEESLKKARTVLGCKERFGGL